MTVEHILGMSVFHSGYFSYNKYIEKLEFPEKSGNIELTVPSVRYSVLKIGRFGLFHKEVVKR